MLRREDCDPLHARTSHGPEAAQLLACSSIAGSVRRLGSASRHWRGGRSRASEASIVAAATAVATAGGCRSVIRRLDASRLIQYALLLVVVLPIASVGGRGVEHALCDAAEGRPELP